MLRTNLFEQQFRSVFMPEGYFRVCSQRECQKALMLEAQQHGSILVTKGEVICIMPKLEAGWTRVCGGIKS